MQNSRKEARHPLIRYPLYPPWTLCPRLLSLGLGASHALDSAHNLSPDTRKLESIEPGRNRLGDISIEISKVLCAAIELNDPAGDVEVGKLALGGVLELDELGRSAQDVAVAAVEGAAGEAGRDGDDRAVSGDGGVGADTGLVVEDAEGDLGNGLGDGCCGGSEGHDGGSGEGGGELHFCGLGCWFWWFGS